MTPGLHTTRVRPEWIGKRGYKHVVTDAQIEDQIREEIAEAIGEDPDNINVHGIRRKNTTRGAVYHMIQPGRKLYRNVEVGEIVVSYNIAKGEQP